MNLFEIAAREKYRFETSKGSLTVEELWDLPLTSDTGKLNLDDIAVSLHTKTNAASRVSFVKETKTDTASLNKFEIVRHIIQTRMAENKAKLEESERKQKKDTLLGILAEKQTAGLREMSVEDLQREIAKL